MDKATADSNLRQAILDHAEAYEMIVSGSLLSDFVIVASWLPEDIGRTQYSIHHYNKDGSFHTVVGLLHSGIQFMNENLANQMFREEE